MGLSRRAYAAQRGVNHTAGAKAIRSGRISVQPDGSINPERADVEWDRSTDPESCGAGKPGARIVVFAITLTSLSIAEIDLRLPWNWRIDSASHPISEKIALTLRSPRSALKRYSVDQTM